MHEDDTNPQIEHPPHELGCTVVAIYAAAALLGLVVLAAATVWASWWPGYAALLLIVGLAAVLWALLRAGSHG